MSREYAQQVMTQVKETEQPLKLEFFTKKDRERFRIMLYTLIREDRRTARQLHQAGATSQLRPLYDKVLVHTEGDKELIITLDKGKPEGLVKGPNFLSSGIDPT